MKTLTFNQFKTLPWLHYDKRDLQILFLPTLEHFRQFIQYDPKYNGNISEETVSSLFDFAENNLQNEMNVVHYDGIRAFDVTFDSLSVSYDEAYVLTYYANDNVILLTDKLD